MSDLSNQRSDQVARQADESRAQLSSTIEQLKSKLSPGQIVDDLFQGSGDNASKFVRNLGSTISEHPIPALLIGAGLALLLTGGTSAAASSASDDEQSPRSANTAGSGVTGALSSAASKVGEAAGDMADKVGSLTAKVSDAAGDLAGSVRQTASDMASGVQSTSSQASHRAHRTTDRLSSSLMDTLAEQPLILGAVGLALGAAIGAALPGTTVENQLMGDQAVAIKKQAQDLTSSAIEGVKGAAQQTVEDVKDAARDQGLRAESAAEGARDLGDKAFSVAEKAAETLKRQADDLMPKGS